MTHVVTENCINCKYTDCITVCPTDAFREGMNMLVIDPDPAACIDCAACVPECPTTAIFAESDVPGSMSAFIELNARLAKLWPQITSDGKKGCIGHLEDGKSKLDLLDERPFAE